MKDSPLVGAGGRELHHHDVVAAGVALAVEVSASRVPTDNNGVGTVYLCQLGLDRRSKLTHKIHDEVLVPKYVSVGKTSRN